MENDRVGATEAINSGTPFRPPEPGVRSEPPPGRAEEPPLARDKDELPPTELTPIPSPFTPD